MEMVLIRYEGNGLSRYNGKKCFEAVSKLKIHSSMTSNISHVNFKGLPLPGRREIVPCSLEFLDNSPNCLL